MHHKFSEPIISQERSWRLLLIFSLGWNCLIHRHWVDWRDNCFFEVTYLLYLIYYFFTLHCHLVLHCIQYVHIPRINPRASLCSNWRPILGFCPQLCSFRSLAKSHSLHLEGRLGSDFEALEGYAYHFCIVQLLSSVRWWFIIDRIAKNVLLTASII